MKRMAVLCLLLLGCSGPSRFALRAPMLSAGDDWPQAQAPEKDEVPDGSSALDVVLLRPLSHTFVPDPNREARDVNALDEVPDSTWFTNRVVSADDLVRGPCPDAGPVFPLTVTSTKEGGQTLGFVALDARHQKYVMKLDHLTRYAQPEISTAADAVASRLYWAIGFNAPCNDVVEVSTSDIQLDPRAEKTSNVGHRKPMKESDLADMLKQATHTQDGKLRLLASRFIDGKDVGTWRDEGTRHDDLNDVIEHEDRRELRGERYLAAWLAHWDSRDANTYDTFVPARGGGGYVVHYFLDFSDAIGGTISRTIWPEPRSGYENINNTWNVVTDGLTLGFVRRPWDEVKTDPRYPNLGFLDVEHFEPLDFASQLPLVRWERAQRQDLAWMARRIALLGEAHVRVAVAAGHLSHPAEEARLVEILMGRRARILRASFERTSPLTALKLRGNELCATDLARVTGIASDAATSYSTELRVGSHLRLAGSPRLARTAQGICVEMPPHFAPAEVALDSAERYATIDLVRTEGRSHTRLRAHFYDLGPRGFALVGIERD